MPRLHESVAYCDGPCDQIVAVCELTRCANDDCGKQVCPDCAVATKDPSLSACSHLCAAAICRRWLWLAWEPLARLRARPVLALPSVILTVS